MPDDANPYRGPDPRSRDFQAERTSGKAIASFVCGLVSFLCAFFTGIPAIILGILGLVDVERSRGQVAGRGFAITGIVTGSIGTLFGSCIMIALLLPAIQAARDAARRNQSTNKLKQVGLALLNYEDQHREFPPAFTTDEKGQPAISWRVLLLPYLEEAPLHAQFHLNEPWDSPHNKTLVGLMPDLYLSPGELNEEPGMTSVVAIVGDEAVFRGATATRASEIADGLSHTIVIVEVANRGIPWTAPRDLSMDEFCRGFNQPGGPKTVYSRGMMCLYADGAVRFHNEEVTPETLRALVTRNGGEPAKPPD